MSSKTYKAAVVHAPGSISVFKLEDRAIPTPKPGWILIHVKAFGMNRSEMFTRQGLSGPAVPFPRVLGIECAGAVASDPSGQFVKGDTVATCMGGMGRVFDGGYAEYCAVPAKQVQKIDQSLVEKLGWETVGAAPEMMQTAYGALFKGLKIGRGQSLLIRGGTTSVGLAAMAIAKAYFGDEVKIGSTTRRSDRSDFLKQNGADHVFVDSGSIAADVKKVFPNGVDKVLELVGTTTVLDSLQCLAKFGSVCMVGMVGNKWTLEHFDPMTAIGSCKSLTCYGGSDVDWMDTPVNELLGMVAEGKMSIGVGKVFKLEEIVEAARCQEENSAGGKIVVLT
jgi:NADPH:quinone reductase-like Zn-dependent oxidoreductase